VSRSIVVQIIIISIIIIVLAGTFYFFQPKQTISPISSKPENKITTEEKQPSETLKVYKDDSGFSFKYPEDVKVIKKDANDPTAYASLEITSSQTKGSMSVKVLDTKLKSVDEWFSDNKLGASTAKKEIKIGEISGKEIDENGKIIAAGLDQNILFTIEVDSQDQKYWIDVYNTILSSFSFVLQQSENASENQVLDESGSDVILEEETIE